MLDLLNMVDVGTDTSLEDPLLSDHAVFSGGGLGIRSIGLRSL
jgi:hypothetical protein